MQIRIHFDVTCPWCFIGLRRLMMALSQRAINDPVLRWQPYFLNPDIPATGIGYDQYLHRKFGSMNRAQRLMFSLSDIGLTAGIHFNFRSIRLVPNTLDAHRLIAIAHHIGRQTAAVDALFIAHFIDGENIADSHVLQRIGTEIGLSTEAITQALNDESLISTLFQESEMPAWSRSVGVPMFVFNDTFTITGAHEPEVFTRMIDLATTSEGLAMAGTPLVTIPQ